VTPPSAPPLPDLRVEHPELAGYPASRDEIPPGEVAEGSYLVRFAQNVGELDELLRLRFRVFNLELDGGSRSRSAPAAISIRSTPSATT
jgi:hypothetical protein